MTKEEQDALSGAISTTINETMQKELEPMVGKMVAKETRELVEKMAIDRDVSGKDITGLTAETKIGFATNVKAVAFGGRLETKTGEALIEETDSRGGYLVPKEVAAAIVRIAASVGIVMSQAQKWPMKADELDIPAYTGAFLEGEYLGTDAAGNVTQMVFDQALLIAKKWQLAFVVGNDLIADANVNLADWLLAIGGESLANMIDKQAFIGTGAPFKGITVDTTVPTFTLPAGETTFDKMTVLTDASDIIGSLEESVLDGAAWYFHRTVWAKLRSQSVGGIPVLPFGGLATPATLQSYTIGGGPKPVGELLGFPVFTSKHLPGTSTAVQDGKIFGVFGNMHAMAYGDKGEMSVAQFNSGAFGGKEIALADQRALVYKHRHALVDSLPVAFVNIKTAGSTI